MAKFTVRYLVFTAVISILAVGLQVIFAPAVILAAYFWPLFAMIALLTYIAYFITRMGVMNGGNGSILSIMLGIGFKFFFSLAVLVVILFKYPENQLVFVINFFLLYFCFSLFEVIFLLRILRHQNKT